MTDFINNNISIEQDIQQYFPVYQDQWITFNSYVDTTGITAVKPYLEITVEIGYGATNLEYFTLNNNTYTAKANPQWAEFITGTTTADVAQSIYWMLYNDERLNYKYNITWSPSIPNKVFVQAVLANPSYNLTFVSNAAHISGSTVNSVTNRRDQDKNNWGMWLELWTKNNTLQTQNYFDSNFNKQLIYTKDYQTNNEYTFNLAPAISKVLWTDAPSQQFTNVNNWFTNVNYRFGEMYSSNNSNLWKQKYIVGESYNYWAFNTSKEVFNINDYISYNAPFVAVVTLSLGLLVGNTLTINGPLTISLTMASTPVNQVGLSNQADLFVTQINAAGTDYVATKPTSNSNQIIITAQNTGGAWDLFFNPDSQWWAVQATSGIDAAPVPTLNGLDNLEVNLDSTQIAYWFYKAIVPAYFAIKQTHTFRDGSTISYTGDFEYVDSTNLYSTTFGLDQGAQWRPYKVQWQVMVKYSPNGTPEAYTTNKTLYINETPEKEGLGKLNLAYQNSWGTFDTLQFTGDNAKVYERNMVSFNKFRDINWTKKQGEMQTAYGDSRLNTTWRTGWMSSNNFLSISEIVKSKRNYDIDNDLLVYIDSVDWQWNNDASLFSCIINVKQSIDEKMID